MSKHPLVEIAESNEEKFYALFDEIDGRLSSNVHGGQKGDYLEVKVLNSEGQLAGIVWFFGPRRAYIDDVRNMVNRKEDQKVPMVLLADEGTTSAGRKELKEVGIEVVKDLEGIEIPEKKVTKEEKKEEKKEKVSFEDDISDSEIDNPLLKLAKRLANRREPEFMSTKKIKGTDYETTELRAYTSNNELLAIYRCVEKDSLGVNIVRRFLEDIEEEELEGIPLALLAKVKFTPSAKKEAGEANINLISVEEEKEAKGTEEQQLLNDRLRRGAVDIVKQRGYELMEKTSPEYSKLVAGSQSLGTYLVAENDKNETLLVLIPSEEVVRVATVREFDEQIDDLNIDDGMLIAMKRFTYTAEREAKEYGILALRKNHPVFNIFDHELVPEHQLMSDEEVEEMLNKYNARLNQLSRIYEDDPGALAVNAKVGDVIRIIRSEDSRHYRLVVPRPDSGETENTALVKLTQERGEVDLG